ncbi:uncharacterized protein LOC127722157 [Mytilus californianus]|uniref:uncharacterized protein LOC127722157 n=1 Tax=Mytilus californianus TaxID=6549 RepID=UPI00224859C9|nr:uncharacterized protein LOC127722157 [Mytilus californianus]
MASLNSKVDLAKQCIPDSSHGVKRSLSDFETQLLSDDSDEILERHRSKKKGSDSEYRENVSRPEENSGSYFLENIKKNTSEWTAMILPNFQIKFDSDTYASEDYDVFTKGILHFIEKATCSEIFNLFLKGRKEDKEKYECFQYALLEVFDIDCCHIDDIDNEDIQILNQKIEDCHWIDTYIAKTDCNQRLVRRICDRELCTTLNMFMWQLLHMHRKQKENRLKKLSKGMYQELFVSFARIFGLNIVSGSNVEEYSITIKENDFVATPDAIICHPSAFDSDKIFAVITVKQDQDEDNDQVENLSKKQKKSHEDHICSSLKGQHCGQFLCTLPFSVFGNRGMYGFVVQETNVTLTCFKPDDGYYEDSCNGCLREKEAVVTFSKQYNILRKKDRRQLVDMFLDFEKLLKFLSVK